MTSFTVLSDATLAGGKPGTQTIFRALRDNLAAMAEGASGAPRIKQGALDTSLQQLSESVNQQSSGNPTFTGGLYTLGWAVSGGSQLFQARDHLIDPAGYAAGIGLYNSATDAPRTYYFQARYFNATRPYNLGDGDIPVFIYAEVTPAGKVVRIDCADAPPWYYNGPHRYDPRKIITRGNNRFMLLPAILAEHGSVKEAMQHGMNCAAILDRMHTDRMEEVAVTHAIKNRDMALIPSPFRDGPKPGNTVVLLNPVGVLAEKLAILHESTDEMSVTELFMDGHLIFDNTRVAVTAPPGVLVVGARWKLTP